MTELRAILFDTFGTVVDWRSSLIRELTAFGAARQIDADWAGPWWMRGAAPTGQPWTGCGMGICHGRSWTRCIAPRSISYWRNLASPDWTTQIANT